MVLLLVARKADHFSTATFYKEFGGESWPCVNSDQKALKGKSREEVVKALHSSGFDLTWVFPDGRTRNVVR